MEKAKTSCRLKGFTLLELIIVCALFSMILIGALSVLRPVSLLYKQNVEYETSRATSDIVSTYLEGVLNYADRMWIYEDKCADSSVYNEQDELNKFINTYFDGQSGHQTIYIMDVVNDPVVDASGNIIEEGYGRVYMREIGTGKNTIDDTTPKYLAISNGIYEDYGFQIDVQNALPRTLTTTVNVYKKSKTVTPSGVQSQNGVLALVDSNGRNRYESNGVEVVKSSNMLNICYYDVDLNSPTGIPNYVIVYKADGTTSKVSAFYSNPNSASITDATPQSNNYHIIFTLPDQEYYKSAAQNQLEYIDCAPKTITAACYTTKTLDEILEGAGFKVSAKYTNSNVLVEISKGLLNDGTDGWYVQNRASFDTDKKTAGTYSYFVYFESEMTTVNITFEQQPMVTAISAQNLIVSPGDSVSKGMFNVTVVRGGKTEAISSSSYDVTLADGSALDTLTPAAGGVYAVTVKYKGDGAISDDITCNAYILVPQVSGITAGKTKTVYSVGYTLTDADMSDIVVTAEYLPMNVGGVEITPTPTVVTSKAVFTYTTAPLVEGTDYINVSCTVGGSDCTTSIPIEVKSNALDAMFSLTNGNIGDSSGTITVNCVINNPSKQNGWTLKMTVPELSADVNGVVTSSVWSEHYDCSSDTKNSINIVGKDNSESVTIPITITVYWDDAGGPNITALKNMYDELQAGTYAWNYTIE